MSKAKEMLKGTNDDRKLNNTQRKELVELTQSDFSMQKSERQGKTENARQTVIKKAQKDLGYNATRKEIEKYEAKVKDLEAKIENMGFDDNGKALPKEVWHSYNRTYSDMSNTPLRKLLDKLSEPENEDTHTQTHNNIKNRLWLAGTVGEAREILNEIK